MATYRTIADVIAADIKVGRLRAGERLPPHRDFAYERGIAVSTASRVYAELRRRGLIVGEVGRGTYVRDPARPVSALAVEPADKAVDLQLNVAILPDQSSQLAPGLAALLRPDALTAALRPVGAAGTAGDREASAAFLARPEWAPEPDRLLFAGSGRQAIAATLAALAPAGERVAVEALTYPVVKGLAARLGITLVPIRMDEEGIRPDALLQAHRAGPLRAVYLQPCLHNPVGATMSHGRRAELAALLRREGLNAIEDGIYSFLADEAPLAAFAPDNTVFVDSLSKRIAPGLTLGFVAAPPLLKDRIASALRSGGWLAPGLSLAAGRLWMTDGTANRLVAAKRDDARQRHALARELLAGLPLSGDPRAYHLWMELPTGWRADAYAAAAARQGIAITPAGTFAVGPEPAPNAVRLALALPPLDALAPALRALRQLAFANDADVMGE